MVLLLDTVVDARPTWGAFSTSTEIMSSVSFQIGSQICVPNPPRPGPPAPAPVSHVSIHLLSKHATISPNARTGWFSKALTNPDHWALVVHLSQPIRPPDFKTGRTLCATALLDHYNHKSCRRGGLEKGLEGGTFHGVQRPMARSWCINLAVRPIGWHDSDSESPLRSSSSIRGPASKSLGLPPPVSNGMVL